MVDNMDYNEKEADALSPRHFLVQQVQEQSEVCDVTIRVGTWVKRFHQCVLESSPFFAKTFQPGWIERTNRSVDISVGTPEAVETAVMFLYGQEPRITIQNVIHLLDLAEFFVIPNLKAAVVSWLKGREITDNVVGELLQISTFYNIPFPDLDRYIEGHLDTLLHHPEMLALCVDTVRYFLSHRKFSYVIMDDKLQFLLKWVEKDVKNRLACAKKVLKNIDFSEVNTNFFREIPVDYDVAKALKLDELTSSTRAESQKHECIVAVNDEVLLCFNLVKKRWHKIKSSPFKEIYSRVYYARVCGADEHISMIHLHFKDKLYSVNMEADSYQIHKFAREAQPFSPANALRSGNLVFAYTNTFASTRSHSTFDTGIVSDADETIELRALFSLRNQTVDLMCYNNWGSLAILSEETVLVFDVLSQHLYKLSIRLEGDSPQMCPFRDGFVVLDEAICVFILEGETYYRPLKNDDDISYKCTCDGNKLLRFARDTRGWCRCHRFWTRCS